MGESHAVQSGKSNDHGDGLHENRAHCTNAWLVFTRKEEAVTWTWPFLGGRRARSLRTGRGSARLHLLCVPQAATALRPSPAAFHPRGTQGGESLRGPVLGEGRQEGPTLTTWIAGSYLTPLAPEPAVLSFLCSYTLKEDLKAFTDIGRMRASSSPGTERRQRARDPGRAGDKLLKPRTAPSS